MVHSTDQKSEGEKSDISTKAIDWSKVITNAISTIVGAIVLGAGVIVWSAAIRQPEAIRARVDEAKEELKTTQDGLAEELTKVNGELGFLKNELAGLRKELGRFAATLEKESPKPANGSPEEQRVSWFKERPVRQWTPKAFSDEKDRILSRIKKK